MPCYKSNHPTWLQKVQFIKHYAMNTCSTPWKVYFEMGLQAETNLVLNLTGISATEAVYTLLRPKSGRVTRHGGNKGERNRKIGRNGEWIEGKPPPSEALPDSAELIAEQLQLLTGAERPVYNSAGQVLFEIAEPIIHTAYYLTLINAVTDFAFDWYSGILLAPQSKCTLGRFGYECILGPLNSHGYELVTPVSAMFDPVGAQVYAGGILLDQGSWVITIKLQGQNNGFPQSKGQYFNKFVVGYPEMAQCGGVEPMDQPPFADTPVVRMVRRVKGPEWIGLMNSYHAENPLTFNGGFLAEIEGFRI